MRKRLSLLDVRPHIANCFQRRVYVFFDAFIQGLARVLNLSGNIKVNYVLWVDSQLLHNRRLSHDFQNNLNARGIRRFLIEIQLDKFFHPILIDIKVRGWPKPLLD